MSVSTGSPTLAPGDAASRRSATNAMLFGLAIGVAVLQRLLLVGNSDVAWLLTAAERVLDGEQPYVDVIDTNPPFAIWLYTPAALLARLIGARAEWVNDFLVFALAAASLALCVRIALGAGLSDRAALARRLAPMAAILLVLPAVTFGEREHIATIGVLPWIFAQAARVAGRRPAVGDCVIAGALCGLGILIKPHFALAPAFGLLIAFAYSRDWRGFFAVENLVMAVMGVAYASRMIWFEPEFLNAILPKILLAYTPIKYDPISFIRMMAPLEIGMVVLAVEALAFHVARARPPHAIGAAVATSYFAAALIQGKGFGYHLYPPFALILAISIDMGLDARHSSLRASLLAALVFCFGWTRFNAAPDPADLITAVKRIEPHARLAGISFSISASALVARGAGGAWIGSMPCQALTEGVNWLMRYRSPSPETRAALRAVENWDRDLVARDIARRDPDILLIERAPTDWLDWARENPVLTGEMRAYEPAGRYEVRNGGGLEIEIWRRSPAQ